MSKTNKELDEITEVAGQVAKYAFMLAFASSFPKDEALIHHNKENLKLSVESLLQLTK